MQTENGELPLRYTAMDALAQIGHDGDITHFNRPVYKMMRTDLIALSRGLAQFIVTTSSPAVHLILHCTRKSVDKLKGVLS